MLFVNVRLRKELQASSEEGHDIVDTLRKIEDIMNQDNFWKVKRKFGTKTRIARYLLQYLIEQAISENIITVDDAKQVVKTYAEEIINDFHIFNSGEKPCL